jgi:hypothetical protein
MAQPSANKKRLQEQMRRVRTTEGAKKDGNKTKVAESDPATQEEEVDVLTPSIPTTPITPKIPVTEKQRSHLINARKANETKMKMDKVEEKSVKNYMKFMTERKRKLCNFMFSIFKVDIFRKHCY